jgi:hypothetical protein
MNFTEPQWNKLRFRYLQYTGSIEEEITFIEPQLTKRNAVKSKSNINIPELIENALKELKLKETL